MKDTEAVLLLFIAQDKDGPLPLENIISTIQTMAIADHFYHVK